MVRSKYAGCLGTKGRMLGVAN